MRNNLVSCTVKFEDSKHNYVTSVNGNLSDDQIKSYFVNKYFNVGHYPVDNLQKCVAVEIER